MYPSRLAKSTVTYYCDIWWIKKPIHIITCSSCTCAPLYVNILSFNSQPVLLKGFGSFITVTFFPTLLTGTFVLLFYLLFKFTYNPCILHNQIVYPADYLFLINPSQHIYLTINKINHPYDIVFGQDIAFLHFFQEG